MKYLGKRKLIKFAKSLGHKFVCPMKEMEYHFNRGDEWIEDYTNDYHTYVEIWATNCRAIHVDVYSVDNFDVKTQILHTKYLDEKKVYESGKDIPTYYGK